MRFSLTLATIAAVAVSSLSRAGEAVRLEDPTTNPGFIAFYNNDYDGAVAYFGEQVKAHPDDPAQYNHLAQSILYREMFRDGVLESQLVTGNNAFLRRAKMEISPEDKQRFFDSVHQAVQLGEARLKKDPKDVQAVYSLAVTHGLRANYSFLVEKAWMDSLHEATAARKLSQQALRLDPNLVDARLILGLDEYVVGCLPFYLRAVGTIGGFHGDKRGGIAQLQSVSRTGVINRDRKSVV